MVVVIIMIITRKNVSLTLIKYFERPEQNHENMNLPSTSKYCQKTEQNTKILHQLTSSTDFPSTTVQTVLQLCSLTPCGSDRSGISFSNWSLA